MTLRLNFEQALVSQGQLKFMAYNAADCTGTREIADKLQPRLRGAALKTYGFERRCQNPAFAMMRRGIRVDEKMRDKVLERLEEDIQAELEAVAQLPLVLENWDGTEKETGECPTPTRKDRKHKWQPLKEKQLSTDGQVVGEIQRTEEERICLTCGASRFRPAPFNANSSPQVIHLLYDLLGIPPHRNKTGAISADEETLVRVAKKYPKVAPLIGWEPDEKAGIEGQGILYVRSLAKQRGEIAAPLENGRYMFSMNIGATWSGRSSSSKNPEGYGGNVQNKAQRQRPMFIADLGYEMGNFDLCQAESLIVAYLAEDEAYIQAHLSGDVHTSNTRILYPELPWTGDLKTDKKIASERNPPWDPAPGHDYRFQAKRITHGYAYGLSPAGVAMHAKIPRRVAEEAHERLHEAYPGIEDVFQARVRETVRAQLPLETPVGRSILLMGRPWDDSTYRQGYAAVPQSTVADVVWIACCLIHRDLDPDLVRLLQNGYDSILCQWRLGERERAVPEIVKRMTLRLRINGRDCIIPVEGSAGGNWGKKGKDNPNGQVEIYRG